MTELTDFPDSDREAVRLLRQLMRLRGFLEQSEVLSKLAVEIHPAGDPSSPWMSELLRMTIAGLPTRAQVAAAEALFGESGRHLKLSGRQERAGEALGYRWERFRKVYLDRFLLEFVASLRAHAATVDGKTIESQVPTRHADVEAKPPSTVGEAIRSVDQAVIVDGNLLLVKTNGNVLGVTLSIAGMAKLRANRVELLRNPALAMEFAIAEGAATGGHRPGSDSGAE